MSGILYTQPTEQECSEALNAAERDKLASPCRCARERSDKARSVEIIRDGESSPDPMLHATDRNLHGAHSVLRACPESRVLLSEKPVAEKTGTVKTKSAYDTPEHGDGERILVTRYWPKPRSKATLKLSPKFGWVRELAPSAELLDDWKNGRLAWEQYTFRYLEEMKKQTDIINALAEAATARTITLLCVEKENNPHCHRHLLKKLIEKALEKLIEY